MTRRLVLRPTILLLALLASNARASTPTPVAVSPGHPATPLAVEARCPTFSWAAVPDSSTHELVVYELGSEDGTEPILRLSERLPAAASSFTPDLDRCLERGRTYAWSVRTLGAGQPSDWSRPRLFDVARIEEMELKPIWLDGAGGPDRASPPYRSTPSTSDDPRRERAKGEVTEPSKEARVASRGVIPNKLTVDGGVAAELFTGSGSGLINVDADTVDGLDANAFAPAAHGHDASEITSGVLTDARIPGAIARDAEVAASYLGTAGGAISGNLGIGTTAVQAQLHVEGISIEVPPTYLEGDDVVIEDQDAVIGLYSSTQGSAGSAVVLGETADNSNISFGKWAMVRETITGGQDLRFTFGNDANYFSNPIRLEIGDDGELRGKGIPRAFGVIAANGTVLAGGEYIDTVTVPPSPNQAYFINLVDNSLHDCDVHPVSVTVRESDAIRSGQYVCNPASPGFEGSLVVIILDSLGANKTAPFSFFVY